MALHLHSAAICLSEHRLGTRHLSALQTARACSAAQSCLTLCNPMHCSPPDSSVRGIFRARILDRVVDKLVQSVSSESSCSCQGSPTLQQTPSGFSSLLQGRRAQEL